MSLTNVVQYLKPKQEAFAQGLARGLPVLEAYASAGFRPDQGNAARLSGNPLVRQRVRELQEEAKTELAVQKKVDSIALQRMASQRQFDFDWVMLQAKSILDDAMTLSKHKEALNALEFMAGMLGYTNKKNNDPNKRAPGDADNHARSQVNIQVLNQIARRLDDNVGDDAEAGVEIDSEAVEDVDRIMSVIGPGDATEGAD